MRSHIPHKYAALLLVVATLIAASGWIFSKEAIAYLPIFGFIGLRFLLASICLLPFVIVILAGLTPLIFLKHFVSGL
jgi:drug/metabolite transporter (DMT)-like permease